MGVFKDLWISVCARVCACMMVDLEKCTKGLNGCPLWRIAAISILNGD